MRYGAATFFTFTYFFCQQSVWHSRCYLVKVHLRRSAVCWLLLRYKGKNCWDLFAAINLLDIVHLLLWCLFLYVCKSDVSGIARVAVNDAQNNLNALKFQCRKILTKKKNNNNIVPKKYHFLCFFTSLLSLFCNSTNTLAVFFIVIITIQHSVHTEMEKHWRKIFIFIVIAAIGTDFAYGAHFPFLLFFYVVKTSSAVESKKNCFWIFFFAASVSSMGIFLLLFVYPTKMQNKTMKAHNESNWLSKLSNEW